MKCRWGDRRDASGEGPLRADIGPKIDARVSDGFRRARSVRLPRKPLELPRKAER